MAKPEWGIKRICPNCGARYYDLRKDPPVCPNCGTDFDPEALLKSRRARPAPVDEVVKKVPVVAEDEDLGLAEAEEEIADLEEVEDDVGVEDLEEDAVAETADEEEDVLLEDASELGEDDDMGEVVDIDSDEEER
ncbi:MAG TPA: TIGR02300 family protein [Azospirillaceae bacterium]|nr:TIGR02300 family protein [Azospirillaceae bacterium]